MVSSSVRTLVLSSCVLSLSIIVQLTDRLGHAPAEQALLDGGKAAPIDGKRGDGGSIRGAARDASDWPGRHEGAGLRGPHLPI